MMDEMNVLNAPKKVVDGLTEVFEGLAQMFEGVSDQLELLGADAVPEDKRIFPIVDQEAPAVSEKKGAAASHPRSPRRSHFPEYRRCAPVEPDIARSGAETLSCRSRGSR